MPEISLRAYVQEVDELVEKERLEEAIAHCRYILQLYAKHLETYRLLGKAYLEAKRHTDAADIFQRVLSAVPDDFVSHVGMAIVREDEGNLDSAIWHMRRAFETNPSNPAIQQEMKRLIGKRDGLEPHKVRLTRGALARMYAHGELYSQAIDELRSKLQEETDRPDLQVLLAKMYWQTGQRSEAISIANQILEKLPYCEEANRILAANLQAKDRIEEAAVYHRRLANLDPYAAYVESALLDASSVEDNVVLLQRLEWEAGEPLPSGAPGQPGWAETLGMEMREASEGEAEEAKLPQTGPLPSWLEPGEPPPFEPAAEKELRAEMEQQGAGEFEEDIQAEFTEQLEKTEVEPSDSLLDDELVFEEGAEPSQEDDAEISIEDSELEEDGVGPGAIGVAAAAAGIAAGLVGDKDDEETAEQFEPAPDEPPVSEAAAIGAAAGMFDQPGAEDPGDIDVPEEVLPPEDIFGGPIAEDEPEIEADIAVSPEEGVTADESEIPDWMQEAGWTESTGDAEETPVSFSDQELDALADGQLIDDAVSDEDAELTPAELPDWIHDIAPEDDDGAVSDDSLPDWIDTEAPSTDEEPIEEAPEAAAELDVTGVDGEEESFPTADPDTSELPTWITEEPPGATETIVTWLEDKDSDTVEEELAEASELPDWMRDTGPLDDTFGPESVATEDEPEIAFDEEPTIDEPAGEPPEIPEITGEPTESSEEGWLSAVAAVAADDGTEVPESEAEAVEAPDWLSDAMGEPGGEEAEPGLGIAAAAAAGMLAAGGEGDDEQEEESLAAEVADVEEAASLEEPPISEPELPVEPVDTVPDLAEAEEPYPDPAPGDEAAVSSTPDWLEEIGSQPQQPVTTDTAEWLDGLEIDGEVADAQPETETPDWLKGLADEAADTEGSGAASAPDWLREIGEPGSVEQESTLEAEQEVGQPIEEDVGGAPDWLQGLSVDEDRPDYVAPQPEVEIEPAPEPVTELEPLEELEEEVLAAPSEEDPDVMEWLEDLAAKQAEAPDDEKIAAAAEVAAAAAPVLEERDIPDEPEEGLEWLEQLADQRGIDVDVALPDQPAPIQDEAEAEPEPDVEPVSELDTAPSWLDSMSTQPIPEVDLEALEAATRGEEVSPDAETIKAKGSEVQAQLEQAQVEADTEEAPPEVAPDDITIEARASDLQATMEAAEAEADLAEGAEPSEDEAPLGEEVPAWLIAAAGQTEEPQLEEPIAETEVQPPPAESLDQPEAELVGPEEAADVDISSAAGAEAVEEAAEAIEEVFEVQEEAQKLEPVEAETELIEEAHVEPEPAAPLDEVTPTVDEELPPEVSTPAKEVDLLEQSRQALASGDMPTALEMYSELIKRKKSLDSVIEDLRLAVDRTPENADLWQALGDAYMRDDQTDEAIDAYRRGMEAA